MTTSHPETISSFPACGYAGELKRAIEIADHYGFKLINPLPIEKIDRDHADKYGCAHEHAAITRLAERDATTRDGDTILFAHTRKIPYKNRLQLRLEVVGDKESSAEGLLLQATHAILREHGHTNTTTAINSVGGRETGSGFPQAIAAFFRSRLSALHPECRDAIRQSTFAPLRCSHPACIEARAEAPQSLNFLSEPSRRHFKEVLEYLEHLEMPYTIDPWLVGNEHYTTKTVFAVGTPDDAEDGVVSARTFKDIFALGERYDYLSKKLGSKRSIPAVHATIDLGTHTTKERYTNSRSSRKPQAYVIQVGLPAKIRSLRAHEELRQAHINVSITLHKKSVGEQMEHAQALGAPLLVIIGQKEVTDNVALVRHLNTNQQYTIPFAQLSSHLKQVIGSKKGA